MKKWIRRGIIVFLVFVFLVAVFWFVFADYLVKRGIEKAGSRIVGAKVELAEADLTLLPFGVGLTELQVTNPDEPMRNMFEIEHIRLAMEIGYLLQRKVVGEEMTLDGVRFDTPRKVSGQLVDKPSKQEKNGRKETGSFSIPKLSVADVESVLKKEKLQTLIEAEQLKKDIQAEQENYKNLLKTLPDKKKLEGYKARLKNMKGGKSLDSILGASSELKTVKKDIENDLNSLKQAKGDLKGKIAAYKARFKRLKKMPKKDLRRLKKKYSLSSQGAGNMTLLLFGPKYSDWVTKGLSLYEKLKPYMEKPDLSKKEIEDQPVAQVKDSDLESKEDSSIPDVLIRMAKVSLLLDAGTIKGEVKNIASDQVVYGKPITFVFAGEKLQDIGKLNVEGTLDRTVYQQAMDTVVATCKGYRLTNTSISDDPDLPVILKDALADVQLDINIKNQSIDSKLISNLDSVSFETGGQGDKDPLKAAMADALTEISKFRVEAGLKGTLEKNDISIKSDIDQVLGKAMKNVVKKQAKAFEQKLKQQIGKKTGGILKGLDSNLAGFGSIDKELGDRLDFGDGLLGNTKLF
jgi:uncharacterized protein (TIGR03545 family)